MNNNKDDLRNRRKRELARSSLESVRGHEQTPTMFSSLGSRTSDRAAKQKASAERKAAIARALMRRGSR